MTFAREVEDADGRLNHTEPNAGDSRTLQLPNTNLADHIRLIAHNPTGVNLQLQPAAGSFFDGSAGLMKTFHPRRAFRSEGRDLECILLALLGSLSMKPRSNTEKENENGSQKSAM